MRTLSRSSIRLLVAASLVLGVEVFISWWLGWNSRGSTAPWMSFLALLLSVAVLAVPARRSRLDSAKLFWALLLVLYGIHTLAMIEARVFMGVEINELVALSLQSLVRALLVAGTLIWATGPRSEATPDSDEVSKPRRPFRWILRLVQASVAYVILFTVAGLLIYPYIREFYETQNMITDPRILFPVEFLRGAGLVLISLPLMYSLRWGRLKSGLAIGAWLAVLGGVAALLEPNPYIPPAIRFYHMIEIGWSNFVFGLVIGRLFADPRSEIGAHEINVDSLDEELDIRRNHAVHRKPLSVH